jgi:hypothetical protein
MCNVSLWHQEEGQMRRKMRVSFIHTTMRIRTISITG